MISHGYTVKEHDDPIVDIAEAAMNQFSEVLEPGAYLVDIVPLCKSPVSGRPTAGGIDLIFLSPPNRNGLYSAICPRVVPQSRVESEGQAVRRHPERHDGRASPIREGSNGGLMFVLEILRSLYHIPPLFVPSHGC